ncbi:MAG: DUF3592 domain-containing protein [Gemmatimonadales bacterium]
MAGSLIVFGAFIVVAAALSFVHVRRVLREAKASVTWPSVTGRIVESELAFELIKSGQSVYRQYEAHVVYEYSIGGRTYRCDRVSFTDDDSSSLQPVQRTVNRYPRDARVTVYCDLQKPETAVLERGAAAVRKARIVTVAMGLFGLGLALLGVFLAGR